MKKITDTLSKEIVSAYEGEICGIVTNAYIDGKLSRVRGYKVSSDERDDGRLLPLSRLLGEGDALIVRNHTALRDADSAECPMGAKIFDTTGTFLGVLRDLSFDERTGQVLSLVADERELTPKGVVAFGKRVVILRAPCHEKTVFRHRPKRVSLASAPYERSLLPLPAEKSATAEEGAEAQSVETPIEPLFYQEYAFLLGRKVIKTIGTPADIVAQESEIVTPEVIMRAREKGKLVELTVNSRK